MGSYAVQNGSMKPEGSGNYLFDKEPGILIATLGHALHFVVWVEKIEYLIFDKADGMLDRGFYSKIRDIISNCNMKPKLMYNVNKLTESDDTLNASDDLKLKLRDRWDVRISMRESGSFNYVVQNA